MRKTMRKIKGVFIGLLVLVCSVPSSVITYASGVADSDKIVEKVSKYIFVNEDGSPEYMRVQAVEDGVDEYVLEVADSAYQFMLVQYQYDTTGMEPRWPVYGNWCGPKYGSGTPIDLLDVGCRSHDNCYRSRGYHKCSCDRDFLNHINRNISKMSGGQKTAANAMKVWLNKKLSKQTSTGGNLSCKL